MIKANKAIITHDYVAWRIDNGSDTIFSGTNSDGQTVFGTRIIDDKIKNKLIHKDHFKDVYIYNVMRGGVDIHKNFSAVYGYMLTNSEVFSIHESDTSYHINRVELSMEVINYINNLMQGVGEGVDKEEINKR